MITVDGSQGEGGGQILRSALALALVTGQPVALRQIRARRPRPGLMPQHLAAVAAATRIGNARTVGAAPGSQELLFEPQGVVPGRYHFAVGTAGSCTLVLQTVLPALLLAAGESELELEGGTHNPLAPPFEFLARSFLPLLGRMGARVEAVLERPGFYPAGGGRLRVRITPPAGGRLRPLELPVRGAILRREAEALVARLPAAIGRRELAVLGRGLQLRAEELRLRLVADSAGPGNVLQAALTGEAGVTELFTAFGQRGVPAEAVARGLAAEVREYLAAPDVPVGRHLADQLLLPLALAGGGAFRTLPPTPHFESNRQVIETFLPVRITAAAESGGGVQVRVECLEERGSR